MATVPSPLVSSTPGRPQPVGHARPVGPAPPVGHAPPLSSPSPPRPFLRGHHTFPGEASPVDTTVFTPTLASAGGALVTTPRDTGRPGVGYGLGLFRRELGCGGFFWGHGGALLGYHNENGVTEDGRRAVTVATNGLDTADEPAQDRVDAAPLDLVDRALCAA